MADLIALLPPCEVCGGRATVATLDTMVSEEPMTDAEGRRWSVVSGHGGYRVRCKKHPHYIRHFTRADFDRRHGQQEVKPHG